MYPKQIHKTRERKVGWALKTGGMGLKKCIPGEKQVRFHFWKVYIYATASFRRGVLCFLNCTLDHSWGIFLFKLCEFVACVIMGGLWCHPYATGNFIIKCYPVIPALLNRKYTNIFVIYLQFPSACEVYLQWTI